MSKNKVLKEYINNIYNKDRNYDIVFSKIKNKNNIRKILNIAAIFLITMMIGVTLPKIYAKIAWNIEYKEYEKREINTFKEAINDAIEDGYAEKLNMDYSYKNGIGVKIDSLMITKDSYIMNVNIKIDDYKNINSDTFDFGYAVYDENNNIYQVNDRYDYGTGLTEIYERKLCTELGIKYSDNDIYSINQATSSEKVKMLFKDGELQTQVIIKSLKGFPKSKKIYIRIFDIGFIMKDEKVKNSGKIEITDAEDFKLSDSEWQFELEIPERFYNRNTIELQLAEKINGIELKKAELSETALILEINMKDESINALNRDNIYITDEFENNYTYGSYSVNKGLAQISFNIEKKDLLKHLYLNISIGKYNEKIKLSKKNIE